jgi:hypothetical protein
MHSATSRIGWRASCILLAALALLATAGGATANVALTRVSADPYTNLSSQHATEVEPDTFAFGSTVVATFQVGRYFDGGATNTGFVRSGDGGTTWDAPGFLPGLTSTAGAASPYERVSDPSVAHDAKHNVWLIASLPLLPSVESPTVLVSRSTDDGKTWSSPTSIPQPAAKSVDLDKSWIVCDEVATSPFFGNCYVEVDNFGEGDRLLMSTSTDGGFTWSTPVQTAGRDKGLGGQPLVQPNGTVVVPFESLKGKISAFVSKDGGTSWTKAVQVSAARFHDSAGGLRTDPLPSAEIDGAGNVYVAWQDCRFRSRCAANDIVFSKSSDGVNWSAAARVPIDDVASGADHFLPGLAVDRATSGAGAHLALTYYFYPDTTCAAGCELDVGYISSPDGGAHWGAPTQLAGPMTLAEIAPTSQGPMVGDYISTSFAAGKATTVFAVGAPPEVGPGAPAFNEAMYAPTSPLGVTAVAAATRASSSAGVVTGEGIGATHVALRRR